MLAFVADVAGQLAETGKWKPGSRHEKQTHKDQQNSRYDQHLTYLSWRSVHLGRYEGCLLTARRTAAKSTFQKLMVNPRRVVVKRALSTTGLRPFARNFVYNQAEFGMVATAVSGRLVPRS